MTNHTQKIVVDAEVASVADLYIELIRELTKIRDTLVGLDASEYALVAVKRFLDANEMVFVSGITRPLGSLASAIQDLKAGGKPDLFQIEEPLTKGRPMAPSADVLKAVAAACLEFLCKRSSESLEKSAKFIREELNKLGITVYGRNRAITSATVRGWRAEMKGRNSAFANRVFKITLCKLKEVASDPITPTSARRIVEGALLGLAAEGITPDGKIRK